MFPSNSHAFVNGCCSVMILYLFRFFRVSFLVFHNLFYFLFPLFSSFFTLILYFLFFCFPLSHSLSLFFFNYLFLSVFWEENVRGFQFINGRVFLWKSTKNARECWRHRWDPHSWHHRHYHRNAVCLFRSVGSIANLIHRRINTQTRKYTHRQIFIYTFSYKIEFSR